MGWGKKRRKEFMIGAGRPAGWKKKKKKIFAQVKKEVNKESSG
jgi:hypothetical protein